MTSHRTNSEVLLVNLGTPAAPTTEAVRDFLGEFLADPLVVDWPRFVWLPILRGIVLRKRPERIARLYQSIWSDAGSPLRAQSEALARAVSAQISTPVRAAYRYGTPSLEQEIRKAAERAEHIVVVALFPQRTASSSGSIAREVQRIADSSRLGDRVFFRELAPDDAGYIEALTDRAKCAFAKQESSPDHLLVSFHGIPARVDRKEQERYSQDCARTASALLTKLNWDPAKSTLCFQSRFGPERWLEPATSYVLRELPNRGVCHTSVIAPGFLTDGLETLEELGQQGREEFVAAGGRDLTLVPAVADHAALAKSIARLCSLA